MHPCFRDIFATCDDHQELQYEGTMRGGHWANGVLKMPDGAVYASVQNGVPFFVPPEQDPWGDDETVARTLEEDGASRETLIASNWEWSVARWHQAKDPSRIQRIVDHGGLMLIVACGPGGSHGAHILDLDPEAKLLLSDIGGWIAEEWGRFAGEKGIWPYLSCAQLDARRVPIRSGSLDCVDGAGALVEIGEPALAVQEAFRVLRPGGKLFLSEGMLDPECVSRFPEEGQEQLRAKGFIGTAKAYREHVLSAGFGIVSHHQSPPTTFKLGRSWLADIGEKYGIEIRSAGIAIEAQKPEA